MNDDANVNFNPYIGNINGVIVDTIKKYLMGLQTCIPAIVKEVVSREQVIVTPAVEQIDSKWQNVPWANIKLPVSTPGGGNVFMSMPLTVGDTGWIIAGDLDPSMFFKDKSRPQRQNIMSRHEYQFGFFVPDVINGYSVNSDDNGALVISTKDGKTKIVLGANSLKIKSDSVIIETTDNASVTIDGVNWKNHTHTASQVAIQSAITGEITVSPDGLTTGGVNV